MEKDEEVNETSKYKVVFADSSRALYSITINGADEMVWQRFPDAIIDWSKGGYAQAYKNQLAYNRGDVPVARIEFGT